MHHFTVAMLYAMTDRAGGMPARQQELLAGIAPNGTLMASGWAEGRTAQNILVPAVTATPTEGGWLLSGSKKPCTLSRSMDLLTASVAVPGADGTPELALALVPADSPGISVHPFWGNPLLAGAESDEVRLQDVFVPTDMVVRTDPEDPGRLDDLQTAGFIWFEMLISAGYTGVATALAETVLERGRGSNTERLAVALGVESAFALLEGTARAVRDGMAGEEAVAAVLVARFAAQDALVSAADRAMELLGGIDFIRSGRNAALAAAVRPLAFHPPSRGSSADALLAWFGGEPLVLS
jgi:alkylation response protein AidB-like acyl-CoA dehydrogenase